MRLALASGVCTSLLLFVSFASASLKMQHVLGAAALFFLAVGLLGAALVRFGQEVGIGIAEGRSLPMRDLQRAGVGS
jgi:hypothetical protein